MHHKCSNTASSPSCQTSNTPVPIPLVSSGYFAFAGKTYIVLVDTVVALMMSEKSLWHMTEVYIVCNLWHLSHFISCFYPQDEIYLQNSLQVVSNPPTYHHHNDSPGRDQDQCSWQCQPPPLALVPDNNWPVIKLCQTKTVKELISTLRDFFCTFGLPEQLATDGRSSYMAASTQKFPSDWGVSHRVSHRVSTAYNPHSNLRAWTAVKSMKRLIAKNIDSKGSLNTDNLALVLL